MTETEEASESKEGRERGGDGWGEDEVLSFSPFFHRFDGFCCNIDFFQNTEK